MDSIENGIIGMKRHVVMRLIKIFGEKLCGEDACKKIKALIGIGLELLLWTECYLFRWAVQSPNLMSFLIKKKDVRSCFVLTRSMCVRIGLAAFDLNFLKVVEEIVKKFIHALLLERSEDYILKKQSSEMMIDFFNSNFFQSEEVGSIPSSSSFKITLHHLFVALRNQMETTYSSDLFYALSAHLLRIVKKTFGVPFRFDGVYESKKIEIDFVIVTVGNPIFRTSSFLLFLDSPITVGALRARIAARLNTPAATLVIENRDFEAAMQDDVLCADDASLSKACARTYVRPLGGYVRKEGVEWQYDQDVVVSVTGSVNAYVYDTHPISKFTFIPCNSEGVPDVPTALMPDAASVGAGAACSTSTSSGSGTSTNTDTGTGTGASTAGGFVLAVTADMRVASLFERVVAAMPGDYIDVMLYSPCTSRVLNDEDEHLTLARLNLPDGVVFQARRMGEGTAMGAVLGRMRRKRMERGNRETEEKKERRKWEREAEDEGRVAAIYVRTLTRDMVKAEYCGTVDDVKIVLSAKMGIEVEDMRLIFAGLQLEDTRRLEDYNIHTENTLHLVLRLGRRK